MKPEIRARGQFASDNNAGICPEAFAALGEANQGHATGYGDDPWTEQAANMIRDLFKTPCRAFFVFGGTAANALALASLCRPYHGVLCHEHAHVETAECGAPEFFTGGAKLLPLPGRDGKIDPAAIEARLQERTDVHYPKPGAVSLSQPTEAGTVYSVNELNAVGETARKFGLRVQMDGARFANAVASLGVHPAEITSQTGVDVLCFGGTKNGMAVGDAVVFFDLELAEEFAYRRKQAGQLASKMRFLSASWVGMLRDGAWLRHARRANAMAKRLETALREVPQLKIVHPCQTNGVFVQMPGTTIRALRDRGWRFYTHVNPEDCRLMCSWDTTEEDVDEFAADVRGLIST
jgi:threonine aldolase